MERYSMIGPIGKGASGKVFMCNDEVTDSVVAVKWIPFASSGEGQLVLREIAVLKKLNQSNHDNIVRLLDVVEQKGGANLVFEYMERNLSNAIYSPVELDFSRHIKSILFQILEGVSHCHSQKVIHRDVKPMNLLIDSENTIVKLADFGAAITSDVPLILTPTTAGTLQYKAPELLMAASYSNAVDMWAVGCIFAEMVRRRPLFGFLNAKAVMREIIRIFGFPEEREWPGVILCMVWLFGESQCPRKASKKLADLVPSLEPEGLDLLSKMLCLYPRKRITADEALQHPYLRGVRAAVAKQKLGTVSTTRNCDCCCTSMFFWMRDQD
ncbi:hypothetical protein ACP275_02G142500 [Erythranthe tilingii]